MKKHITVLPGDGIGPEVIAQAEKVMQAVNQQFGHEFTYSHDLIGAAAIAKQGTPLSDEVVAQCAESDAVLLGAIGDPLYDNNPDLKVRPEQGLLKLRKDLQLHTNIRPIKTYPNMAEASPLKNKVIDGVDLVIYRELTGGLYFGEKVLSEDGNTASDSCTYTRTEIERIAMRAFQHAMQRNKRIALVDKANVLETSRLWRRVVAGVSEAYPDVQLVNIFVDNAAMQLMLNPGQFDVVLTENLFGDILSDLSSVITGSLGMLPSASIGERGAMFEPVHGSYPQAAGKDLANPMATILSVAMMYDYFELHREARAIEKAVDWALSEGIVTQDVDASSDYGCKKVGDLISAYIESGEKLRLNRKNMIYGSFLL